MNILEIKNYFLKIFIFNFLVLKNQSVWASFR